jgi:hypothetical protein
MEVDGQTEVKAVDTTTGEHLVLRAPYDGKLVVTAHATRIEPDPNWPDDMTRELERFMRDHNLSRLEAYWNAVPPEET